MDRTELHDLLVEVLDKHRPSYLREDRKPFPKITTLYDERIRREGIEPKPTRPDLSAMPEPTRYDPTAIPEPTRIDPTTIPEPAREEPEDVSLVDRFLDLVSQYTAETKGVEETAKISVDEATKDIKGKGRGMGAAAATTDTTTTIERISQMVDEVKGAEKAVEKGVPDAGRPETIGRGTGLAAATSPEAQEEIGDITDFVRGAKMGAEEQLKGFVRFFTADTGYRDGNVGALMEWAYDGEAPETNILKANAFAGELAGAVLAYAYTLGPAITAVANMAAPAVGKGLTTLGAKQGLQAAVQSARPIPSTLTEKAAQVSARYLEAMGRSAAHLGARTTVMQAFRELAKREPDSLENISEAALWGMLGGAAFGAIRQTPAEYKAWAKNPLKGWREIRMDPNTGQVVGRGGTGTGMWRGPDKLETRQLYTDPTALAQAKAAGAPTTQQVKVPQFKVAPATPENIWPRLQYVELTRSIDPKTHPKLAPKMRQIADIMAKSIPLPGETAKAPKYTTYTPEQVRAMELSDWSKRIGDDLFEQKFGIAKARVPEIVQKAFPQPTATTEAVHLRSLLPGPDVPLKAGPPAYGRTPDPMAGNVKNVIIRGLNQGYKQEQVANRVYTELRKMGDPTTYQDVLSAVTELSKQATPITKATGVPKEAEQAIHAAFDAGVRVDQIAPKVSKSLELAGVEVGHPALQTAIYHIQADRFYQQEEEVAPVRDLDRDVLESLRPYKSVQEVSEAVGRYMKAGEKGQASRLKGDLVAAQEDAELLWDNPDLATDLQTKPPIDPTKWWSTVPIEGAPAQPVEVPIPEAPPVEPVPETPAPIVPEAPPIPAPEAPAEIQVGDTVRIKGREDIYTVSDISDPSLVAMETEDGTVLQAGRAKIEKAEPPAPVEEPAPELPPFTPAVEGTETVVYNADNTPLNVKYTVANLPDLIASHDADLWTNPLYPKELQPRDRSKLASEEQISRYVGIFNPERLGANTVISDGAPIIGPDGVVETGNARTILLQRIYKDHPNKVEMYKDFLKTNAAQFGLTPEQIDSVEQPALVRLRLDDVDREAFARQGNIPTVAAMSAVEVAQQDAKQLTSDILKYFAPNDYGRIDTKDNRNFILKFIDQIVPAAEHGPMYDAQGQLTQDGVRRIRNAIFSRLYGEQTALEKLAEDRDPNVANVITSMVNAAPALLKIKEGTEDGTLFPLDIANDIAQAMVKMSDLRDQGMTVKQFHEQPQLFQADLTPLGNDLLDIIEKYKRSAKKLKDILTEYANVVVRAGNPQQDPVFRTGNAPTKAEALQEALRRVGELDEGQTTLFYHPRMGLERTEGEKQTRAIRATEQAFSQEAAKEALGGREFLTPKPKPKPERKQDRATRDKIINIIQEKVIFRTGNVRSKNAMMIYDTEKKIIRAQARFARDLRAASHELGHALDDMIDMSAERFEHELMNLPYVQALLEDEPGTHKKTALAEGVAEFIRLWATDIDQAKTRAPTLFEYFGPAMYAQDHLVAEWMYRLRREVQTYKNSLSEDPVERVDSMLSEVIGEYDKPVGTLQKYKEKIYDESRLLMNPVHRLFYWLSDSNLPSEMMEERVTGERLGLHQGQWVRSRFENSVGFEKALLEDFRPEIDPNTGLPMFRKDGKNWKAGIEEGETLFGALNKIAHLGSNPQEGGHFLSIAAKYAVARNAVEKHKLGVPSSVFKDDIPGYESTPEAAEAYIKKIEAMPQGPIIKEQVEQLFGAEKGLRQYVHRLLEPIYGKAAIDAYLGKYELATPTKTQRTRQEGGHRQTEHSQRPLRKEKGHDLQIINPFLVLYREIRGLSKLYKTENTKRHLFDMAKEWPAETAPFMEQRRQLPLDKIQIPSSDVAKHIEKLMKEHDIYLAADTPAGEVLMASTFAELMEKAGVANEEGMPFALDDVDLDTIMMDVYRTNLGKIKAKEVVHWNHGDSEVWEILDKDLYTNLMRMPGWKFPSWIMGMVRTINTPFRVGHIVNTRWPLRNIQRDSVIAYAHAEKGFIPLLSSIDGIMNMLWGHSKVGQTIANKVLNDLDVDKKNPFLSIFKDYIKNEQEVYKLHTSLGGTMKSLDIMNEEDANLFMEEIAEKAWGHKNLLGETADWRRLGKTAISAPWSLLKTSVLISEMSTNIGTAKMAMRKGAIPLHGVMDGTDVTVNHNLTGRYTKDIKQLFPFSQPVLHGHYKLWRQMRDPKKRSKTLLKYILMVTVPTLVNYYLTRENKHYQEKPRWQKDWAFLIPLGNPKTTDKFLPIPRPYGVTGFFFGAFVERLADHFYREDPKAFDGWFPGFIRSIFPGVTFWPMYLAYALESGHDFYRRMPIESMADQYKRPRDRYSQWTTETSKLAARWLEGTPLETSPKKLDYVVGNVGGHLARSTIQYVDNALIASGIVARGYDPPAPNMNERWWYGPTVSETRAAGSDSVSYFYDQLRRAELIDEPRTEEEYKLLQRRPNMRKVRDALRDFKNEAQAIYKDPRLTPEQKRSLLDHNEILQINTVRRWRGMEDLPLPRVTR